MIQESPALDLATDCSRFVTQYFEIIDTSSTHIYHSALVLTPRTSIVWKLYKSYAQPPVRIVHGVPLSWDSNAAITKRPFTIGLAAWSPSNKLIAIVRREDVVSDILDIARREDVVVDILDSVTLQRLQSLGVPAQWIPENPRALIFSPGGRMLSCASYCYGSDGGVVSTWDLQTGGLASRVNFPLWDRDRRGPEGDFYITYSMNGRIVGVLHHNNINSGQGQY